MLDLKQTQKENYLKELSKADICLANDGLKDTPGWKIGEYAMLNKAIISTPLKTVIEEFKEGVNYLSLETNADYESIPLLIHDLLKNKKYMQMKKNNQKWSSKYLHPESYIQNIINIMSE